jgi:hypothetical protein
MPDMKKETTELAALYEAMDEESGRQLLSLARKWAARTKTKPQSRSRPVLSLVVYDGRNFQQDIINKVVDPLPVIQCSEPVSNECPDLASTLTG